LINPIISNQIKSSQFDPIRLKEAHQISYIPINKSTTISILIAFWHLHQYFALHSILSRHITDSYQLHHVDINMSSSQEFHFLVIISIRFYVIVIFQTCVASCVQSSTHKWCVAINSIKNAAIDAIKNAIKIENGLEYDNMSIKS
jgi:hypothetical protein